MKRETHAARSGKGTREAFFSQVSRHLSTLYDSVRHQLAALEAAGDLAPGELTVEDVVDDVLLRAYREHVRHPAKRESRSWLLRLAERQLQAEAARQRFEREHGVHLEEDIPETPPAEEAASLGEEILFFYEPEEDWKLEDIVPDLRVPPPGRDDEESEERALRRCVDVALAELPRIWRRALVLRHVKGFSAPRVARVLRRREPEVERMLEHARAYLRQRLVESGCVVDRRDGTLAPHPAT